LAGKEILTYDDLMQIVELIKSAEAFSEFHLKVGDIELDLRKANGAAPPSAPQGIAMSAAPAPAVKATPAAAAAPAAGQPAAVPPPTLGGVQREPAAVPSGHVAIRSPMVGTFYRAPEPGAKPFVAVGQKVAPESIVCIIEVMKLMNSIPAGTSGTVTQVLVGDAEAVDAGEELIVIDPPA
jgi:acetyl-CoA carboxylase biotin carboxyl carrier protein